MDNLAIKLKKEVLLLGQRQKIKCIDLETWKNYKYRDQEYPDSMYLKIGYSYDELEEFIDMALSLGDTPADELPGINGITNITIWLYDEYNRDCWYKLKWDINSPGNLLIGYRMPLIPKGCLPDGYLYVHPRG